MTKKKVVRRKSEWYHDFILHPELEKACQQGTAFQLSILQVNIKAIRSLKWTEANTEHGPAST